MQMTDIVYSYLNCTISNNVSLQRKNYLIISLVQVNIHTNSLVNADSFQANFANTTFQKIPIPHLTRTKKHKFLH